MREYSGKILLRLPKQVHKKLAQEAFQTGRSINQLCTEAIATRYPLKDYNPWKSIERFWSQNQDKDIESEKLAKELREAITEVRRGRKN